MKTILKSGAHQKMGEAPKGSGGYANAANSRLPLDPKLQRAAPKNSSGKGGQKD